MLSRDQPKPCSHLSAVSKAPRIADRRRQCTGRYRSDARNLCQLAAGFALPMPSLDFAFKFTHLPIQFLEVIEQAQNEQPETSRQIVVAVLNDLRYLLG